MALTIGELVGYIDLDDRGWGRKNKQAHDDMRRLRDDIDSIQGPTNRMAAGFLKSANNLSNIPTAAAGIQGTLTILANMSGALGLIPAAGLGAAAAIATLKVGVQGFGDALKNAGDPAKFAESLKELSPSAREAAIAVRDLRDDWQAMADSVQQQLFEGIADDVKKLGDTYIPVLGTGMRGIATEFNYAAQKTAVFLAQGRQVATVTSIFASTKDVVGELAQGMRPLLSILLDVAAVGTELLPGLAGGFGDAAQRAADFVRNARESGQLRQWIVKGLSTIGDLAKLFKQLGQIAATIFKGLNAGGANMLDWLLRVTAQVRDFLRSFEGQQALKALGQALSTVSTVVTQVMLTAFRELAPVIVQLAPGFAELARQVGSMLVSALRVAGPLLQALAGFISANISWLGPLAIALYTGVQAFQGVIGVLRVLNVLAAVNPWVIIIAATIAVATLIITHWDQITAAVGAAWGWLAARATEVWNWIKTVIIDSITNAAKWVGQKIQDIINFFGWLASIPGRVIGWFGELVRGAIGKLGELLSFVGSLPGRILGAIGDLGRLLYQAGRDLLWGLIEGIKDMVMGVVNAVVDAVQTAIDGAYAVLGIGSPSKVFRQIGIWSGRGLVEGLRSMVDPVGMAAQELAGAAIAGMPTTPTPTGIGAPGGYGSPGLGGGPLVHIDTFNATPDQSPEDISVELLWHTKARG